MARNAWGFWLRAFYVFEAKAKITLCLNTNQGLTMFSIANLARWVKWLGLQNMQQSSVMRSQTGRRLARVRRRLFLGMALFMAIGAAMSPRNVGAGEGKVYVFLHTALKTKALESVLSKALNGRDVTAFSRLKDLEGAVAAEPPAAIVSYPPVLASLGQTIALQGQKGRKSNEPYVLLAVGEAYTEDQLNGKRLV